MTNLELAQEFEGAIGRLHVDGHQDGMDYFTCHAVRDGRALNAIEKLEPGLRNRLHAFSELRFGKKRQYARALRLTFLAELAERGDLTTEGLQ